MTGSVNLSSVECTQKTTNVHVPELPEAKELPERRVRAKSDVTDDKVGLALERAQIALKVPGPQMLQQLQMQQQPQMPMNNEQFEELVQQHVRYQMQQLQLQQMQQMNAYMLTKGNVETTIPTIGFDAETAKVAGSIFPMPMWDANRQKTADFTNIMQQMDANRQKTAECTIMLRNIPNKYTQEMLLEHFDAYYRMGIDFFYLLTDFKTKRNGANLGYAFINFSDRACAVAFTRMYANTYLPKFRHSQKRLAVDVARDQGLSFYIEKFRNSSVMGVNKNGTPVLSDDCKPMLFENGERIPFPKPTKPLPPVGLRY